jgi:hypothetical protein
MNSNLSTATHTHKLELIATKNEFWIASLRPAWATKPEQHNSALQNTQGRVEMIIYFPLIVTFYIFSACLLVGKSEN